MPSQPPRQTLAHLPEELLSHILSFLPPSSSSPTIHALTLVCTTLNRIATPLLYTHITLTPASLPYLRPLALLLWISPAHAALVRSFAVRKAYGGHLVPWPQWEGVDVDGVVAGVVGRYVCGKRGERGDGDGEGEAERKEWFKRVREEGEWMAICSLVLRGLEGCERMEFDGWSLVDPRRAASE
jgi:hypothetical protein